MCDVWVDLLVVCDDDDDDDTQRESNGETVDLDSRLQQGNSNKLG